MQISDRIFLAGSGKYGMLSSHSLDCNVYILDCGNGEYAMIDAGSGLEPERIVRNAASDGIRMEDVRTLILTHAHGDHAAGAAFFHERYGMKVVASREAKAWLEQGDMEKTSLAAAIRAGVYPPDFRFDPCPVAKEVREGDVIDLGGLSLLVIDTPGHSRGHVSYVLEHEGTKSLFAGDTLFAGGKVVIQNIWDCSIPEYAHTMAKIHALPIDRLFAGHGPFLLSDARHHAEMALRCFERLDVPPNL